MDTLGQRIKKLRMEKGETTKQVSDAVDLKQDTYKSIENDEVIPREPVLRRIAKYHEVTPEYLLNERNIRLRFLAALKNFFWNNKGKAFRTLIALGAIIVVLSFSIELIERYFLKEQSATTDAMIELIDIFIEEDDAFPTLDVKLRNTGDAMAILYKLEVNMADYFQMNHFRDQHYYLMDISQDYDIALTNESVQTFDIAQVVPANDADRFTVTFAADTGYPFSPAICVFSIKLYYNCDENYVESEKIIMPVDNFCLSDMCLLPDEFVEGIDGELAYDNYTNLCRLNEYDAIKSDYFTKIYNNYSENIHIFL